jgi:hypothetical protein
VALFQDYDSLYGTNTTPQHDLMSHEGAVVSLTAGGNPRAWNLESGDGGGNDGDEFDGSFRRADEFIDYSVHIPAVATTLGEQISLVMSTELVYPFTLLDLDNVRLDVLSLFFRQRRDNNELQFTLCADGKKFEIRNTNVALPVAAEHTTTLTNTGRGRFSDALRLRQDSTVRSSFAEVFRRRNVAVAKHLPSASMQVRK